MIAIKISATDLQLMQQRLGRIPGAMPRALAGAINKVLAKGRTETKRQILSLTTLKSRNVDKRLFVRPRATPARLTGSIWIMGRPFGLVNFRHRATKRGGVSVQMYRTGGGIRLPHAFKATGSNANKHLFQRQLIGGSSIDSRYPGILRRGKRVGRLPIQSLKSRSLRDIVQQSGIESRVRRFIQSDLSRQVRSQIGRFAGGNR
jgi:hypothetical protein